MADKGFKVNNASKGRSKKTFIAVLSVICALIALLTTFIFVKDSFYFSVAQSKTLENDFEGAGKWAEKSGSGEASLLLGYISLREEINAHYPELLSEFDAEIIRGWQETAAALLQECSKYTDINSSIGESLANILSRLEGIMSVVDGYAEIRPTVFNLMELFAEYGRLYTKGADGLNITFTVSEELAKLDNWDSLNAQVAEFAQSFEEGGEVYLLNYLIQEARGESDLLRKAFTESSYGVDESVRLEGENTRTVSTVQNGSETLTLLEKDRYESFMYEEICKALVENLGEFFVY